MVYHVVLCQLHRETKKPVNKRVVRGEAVNAMDAVQQGAKLCRDDEQVLLVRPMWEMDW